jgi:hypothetical protein
MYVRFLLLAALTVAAAGCVTTNPHNLSVDDVRALRLDRVDLVMDPGATIAWLDMKNEIESRGEAAKSSSRSRDEAQAARDFVAARLRERARATVEPPLKATLAGTKPVTARIVVHGVSVPSTAEMLVGVLAPTPPASRMSVTVDFLDARTGVVVVSYPRTVLNTSGGQKLNMGTTGVFSHDPIERMMADLSNRLNSWLLKA